MTPTDYRAGGADAEIRFAIGECSLGAILVARERPGRLRDPAGRRSRRAGARPSGPLPAGRADRRRRRVRAAGGEGGGLRRGARPRPGPAARRARHGLPAARLAGAAGDPGRARPRATARSPAASARPRRCGRWRGPARANALAVAIPCHRVVRNDGALSGLPLGRRAQARAAGAGGRRDAAGRSTGAAPAREAPAVERVDALDWDRVASDLDAHGCAVLERLLAPERVRARWPRSTRTTDMFRSRVVMARHGFGRGEYKYFSYPLPGAHRRACARRSIRACRPIANRWNEAMGIDVRYPAEHRRVPRALPRGGPAQADAAAAAVRAGRLQLPAPGPLRRARLPAPGGDPAVGARPGLHRRRVRADRAASADAVAGRGRAAPAGRRRRVRGPSPAGAGHARRSTA